MSSKPELALDEDDLARHTAKMKLNESRLWHVLVMQLVRRARSRAARSVDPHAPPQGLALVSFGLSVLLAVSFVRAELIVDACMLLVVICICVGLPEMAFSATRARDSQGMLIFAAVNGVGCALSLVRLVLGVLDFTVFTIGVRGPAPAAAAPASPPRTAQGEHEGGWPAVVLVLLLTLSSCTFTQGLLAYVGWRLATNPIYVHMPPDTPSADIDLVVVQPTSLPPSAILQSEDKQPSSDGASGPVLSGSATAEAPLSPKESLRRAQASTAPP